MFSLQAPALLSVVKQCHKQRNLVSYLDLEVRSDVRIVLHPLQRNEKRKVMYIRAKLEYYPNEEIPILGQK